MFNVIVLATALTLPDQSAPPAVQGYRETSLLGGVGVAAGDTAGGLGFSISGLHRISYFEVGGELYGAALFSAVGGIGGLAGLHLGSELSLRALATGGVHGYDGVGRGILSDDPGVGGTLPYVGGRLVLGYAPASGTMFYGLSGMLDEDLGRERRTSTYETEPWFSDGERYTTSSDHSVGQTTWGAMFVMGKRFDLASY